MADALEIELFAVLGFSGGGPFAAACAYALPERLTATGIVSGMGPADAPGMTGGFSWTIPGKSALSRRLILWLMRLGLNKDPAQFLTKSLESMPPADCEALGEPEQAQRFLDCLTEGLRPGTEGARQDAKLYASPWGFRLQDIESPVFLWHGAADSNVPISVGRFVAESIPDCTARFVETEAHISLARHLLPEILEALVDPIDKSASGTTR